MICLKTFENKKAPDFNSYSEWVSFVNENIKIAKTKSKPNDFKGKCKDIELPSFHPYWNLLVRINLRKDLFKLIEKYEECKKDSSKIKYYFNVNTSLHSIENKIKSLKNKVYFNLY